MPVFFLQPFAERNPYFKVNFDLFISILPIFDTSLMPNPMMRKLIFFSILFFSALSLSAQLITTDPFFPTDQDQVVITFRATEGNAGLAGYTGDVYAHTGVITSNSTSTSDWKYVIASWTTNLPKAKLQRIAPDVYTLTIGPNIRAYYAVPQNETILQLAFVFRSAGPVGGSVLEGKTEQNGDIFCKVYEEGLNISFVQPDSKQLLVESGDQVPILVASIAADSTVLFINNQRVAGTLTSQLNYTFVAGQSGSSTLKAFAYGVSATIADSVNIFVRPPLVVAAVPEGMKDGVNYINETSALIVLFAPYKEYVFAVGDFNNWQLSASNYMKRSPDGLRYWIEFNNLVPNQEYAYQFLIDGSLKVADPYSHKILDPWNDSYISEITYPNLKPYPSGKTNGIVSVLQTNRPDYQWQTTDFVPPSADELVIYELHIRDFVGSKRVATVKDTLDYLQRLGVNAIELMPINEFEGNDSWGYNPSFYFATDKAYGTTNDYKAFIDECHRRGIAVIIDMVLNHAFGQSPMVQMYLDGSGQIAPNNPWFNQTCPHPPYCWGYDFNHQSAYTKAFVDRVNNFWLEEFKVDGFRFDFTKGFTNTQGDGSGYDASRIQILKRMADQIWTVNDKAFVILEHFAANTEEKELSNYGMMLWGNVTHAYNQATMGYVSDSDLSWISYKKRGWSEPHLIGYMESHDEERQMYKNIKYGNNSNAAHNPRNLDIGVKRNASAAALFLLVPGPKMIWQFGELAYDFGINHCPDGSYNNNCRTSQKPVRWDYRSEWNRKLLYNYYSSLIALKKSHPVFRTSDFSMDATQLTKKIFLNHTDMSVVVVANFDVVHKNITPGFPLTGTWYSYFGGDSLEVVDVNETILFNPGEFRVYTNKRLSTPDFVGLDEMGEGVDSGLQLYPNPAHNEVVVEMDLQETGFYTLELINAYGKSVEKVIEERMTKGTVQLTLNDLNRFSRGLYFVRLDTGSRFVTKKLILQ